MEEQLKKTLADFLKTDIAAIGSNTVIDRSALGNSILLHRLYAAFSQQGYNVTNYNTIRTYGDLKSRLSLNGTTENGTDNEFVHDTPANNFALNESSSLGLNSIGIDIESVNALESATDYREHPFYQENFTEREISYCLLQADPKASFAGLFAAKEALVKADNGLAGTNFNAIEIQHEKNGKPGFKNFALSISHTADFAIAVAVIETRSGGRDVGTSDVTQNQIPSATPTKGISLFSAAALVLSFLAFLLALFCLLK